MTNKKPQIAYILPTSKTLDESATRRTLPGGRYCSHPLTISVQAWPRLWQSPPSRHELLWLVSQLPVDPAAINYIVADKYVRALQFAESPNQKVFIVPMELASLAGTLGGINQIAAAALGGFGA